jgi:hypothetical protein
MALNDYIIKYSSTDDVSKAGAYSKPSFVVSERSTNTSSSSLTLFGKYSLSYGENLQTDLVRMLENYARDTSPANPTVGQLWFDTNTKILKVYTPTASAPVWNAVGGGSSSGTGTSTGTLAIATISSLGGIIVGAPFEISSYGTLSLPSITFSPAVAAISAPAEYTFASNLQISGGAYSSDNNNFIVPTVSKPASYFNKYFITKSYADANYVKTVSATSLPAWLPTITPTKGVLIYDGTNAVWSKAGAANQVLTCTDNAGTVSWTTLTGGSGSGVLPVATRTILGGVRPQYPLSVNGTGDIALTDVLFRPYVAVVGNTPSVPAEYDFVANVKTTGDAYSADLNNNIGVDITKAPADFDPYFVTKKYADMHYAALGSAGGGASTIATATVLGNIIVGAPFAVSPTGTLTLPGVTYAPASSEYTIDAITKMSKPLYSSDQDNTVDADNSKPSTYYDGYYITKHYAESKYAKLTGGGSGSGTYLLPTATPTVMGGIKVGDPLTVSALGVLSLANVTYDSTKSVYTFAASIASSSELYSSDVRNKVDSDTTKPANYYDGYFITKNYADTRYAPIGAGGGGGGTGTIASVSVVGGIKIAAPFAIDTTGVLALRQVTYTDAITANPTATPPVLAKAAEYVVDAAIKSSKWAYSTDVDNTIGTDSTQSATYYDGFFVTKHYADLHYAPISGSGGTGGTNPYTLTVATATALGGVKIGAPFTIDVAGVLSLPNLTYTTAGTVNTYEFAAGTKTFEIFSTDDDNKIFSDTTKAATYYDKYFVTKHFADTRYMLATANYTLPPASATGLGGVKVLSPLNVSVSGELSLPYFTLDNVKTEYSIAANIKTTLDAYSSDTDNNIGKDATKPASAYDPYFVTKHYADARYAPIASSVLPGSANFTVTEPLMVTGTVLSLRKVVYDSVHDEYRFAANIKALAGAYSADLDNGILKSATIPAADYEYYFTTKHYNDANYLKVGTAIDTSATAKSKNIIEYATGFQLSDLDGKDGALVTKKYVDDKTVGPTTKSTFADKSVIFSSGTTLAESSSFKYDTANNVLSVKNLVLESITTDTTAALTIYNPTASATSGATVNLFSSPVPVTPVVAKPANASGTLLGSVKFGGWDSAAPFVGAKLEAFSSELWTSTAHGCNLVLSVTKNGQRDPVPALTVNNDNSVSFPGGIVETVYNTGSATWTLDPSQGSMQILTTAANTTITMPAAAALTGKSVTVLIKYTGTHTITWTGAISWESNVVPVPTSIAGTTDLFSFFGDGTKIYGLCGGQAFP